MRLSYSPVAPLFLSLVQWTDYRLAGALGLLRILIFVVYFINHIYAYLYVYFEILFSLFVLSTHLRWNACLVSKTWTVSPCLKCVSVSNMCHVYPCLKSLSGAKHVSAFSFCISVRYPCQTYQCCVWCLCFSVTSSRGLAEV